MKIRRMGVLLIVQRLNFFSTFVIFVASPSEFVTIVRSGIERSCIFNAFSRTLYFVAKTLVVVFLLLKFSIIRFVKLQKFGIMIPVQLRICSVIFFRF